MTTDGFKMPGGAATLPDYNAGSQGRRLRSWRPSSAGPNSVTIGSLSTIRNRSRGAVRNDPWAGTASDKLVSNLVGTGIQAKTRNGSKELKAAAKALWDRWAKVLDADGVLDFYGQQALVAREWHEAGECFARMRSRRPSDGLPVPLQVQLIEAEQCPAELYTTASNGNAIRAGIEFDPIGRRVAYWMYRAHPGDVVFTGEAAMLTRVPAEEVLHVYEPLRVGQLRGLPHATSALVRMFNLDSFDDAVLERQKIANLFAGFYVTDPQAAENNPPPGMVGAMQTDTDADDTPLAGLEPGTMQETPPGTKVEFSTPPDAGQNYSDYLRAQLLAIAARHGVPYEVLTGDLRGVSDRALRLILNEFRRLLEQRQWLVLIPQFCQKVREAWWDAAVLSGALDAPGYADKREEYVDTLWVPQGWPYSHPVQDVDADIKAIRAGLASRSATVLSNGEDPEQVDEQQVADNKRADDSGLIYDSDGRHALKTGAPAHEGGTGQQQGQDNGGGPTGQTAAAGQTIIHNHIAAAPAPAVNVAPAAVHVTVPAAAAPHVTVNMPPPAPASQAELEALGKLVAAAERD